MISITTILEDTVELARLEAFLAVARRGSMRAAALALHVGEPALSARIARLEDELGARVFDRTRRGMLLTAAGRTLVPHAERALDAVDAGRQAVRHVEQGDEGELAIAAASAINASVVPELVARFRRFHPGVHLFVHTGTTERVVELVTLGSAQVGLVRESGDWRLQVSPLYEEVLMLMARPDHPFLSEPRVPLARLRDATLILFDRASDDYEATQALLRAEAIAPYSVIEVDSVDTARRLVELGLGVAILPSTAVGADIETGRLARVELTGMGEIRRRIVALERSSPSSWAPVTTLRQLLGEVATYVPGALPLPGSGA